MALSTQTATSDGTLTLLTISFDYLERSEISVFFNGTITNAWSWVGATNKQIQFSPAVPAGTIVLVKRTTNIDQLRHRYQNGAAFTKQSLDESLKQTLHVAQESREGNTTGDFYAPINMHNYRITNMADAVNASDAATLGQVLNLNAVTTSNAAAAATSAGQAGTSANNAQGWYTAQRNVYLGPAAEHPTQSPTGSTLSEGMWYWNTAVKGMYVYSGTAWVTAPAGPQGIQGAQGPQGIQGVQGPQGAPGEVTTAALNSAVATRLPLAGGNVSGEIRVITPNDAALSVSKGSNSWSGSVLFQIAGTLRWNLAHDPDGNFRLHHYDSSGVYVGTIFTASQGTTQRFSIGAVLTVKSAVVTVASGNTGFDANTGDVGMCQLLAGGTAVNLFNGSDGQRITWVIQNSSAGNVGNVMYSNMPLVQTGAFNQGANMWNLIEAVRIQGVWFATITAYG